MLEERSPRGRSRTRSRAHSARRPGPGGRRQPGGHKHTQHEATVTSGAWMLSLVTHHALDIDRLASEFENAIASPATAIEPPAPPTALHIVAPVLDKTGEGDAAGASGHGRGASGQVSWDVF